jgi:hypothetical protein
MFGQDERGLAAFARLGWEMVRSDGDSHVRWNLLSRHHSICAGSPAVTIAATQVTRSFKLDPAAFVKQRL